MEQNIKHKKRMSINPIGKKIFHPDTRHYQVHCHYHRKKLLYLQMVKRQNKKNKKPKSNKNKMPQILNKAK